MAAMTWLVVSTSSLMSVDIAHAKLLTFTGNSSVSYIYDDNVYRTSDNREGDSLMVFSPTFSASLVPRGTKISANYGLKYGRYVVRQNQNYLEHDFSLSSNTKFGNSLIFEPRYTYKFSQDIRGEIETTTAVDEKPDTWSHNGYGLLLDYKLSSSNLSYVFAMNRGEKTYDDPDLKNLTAQSSSYSIKQRYSLSGKTNFNVEFSLAGTDYPYSKPRLPGAQTIRYSTGMEWLVSGRTSSYFTIGNASRKTGGSYPVLGDLFFAMKLNWDHRSYSKFSVNFSRSFIDSALVDQGYYISNSFTVNWSRKLSHRIAAQTSVSTSYLQLNSGNNTLYVNFSPSFNFNLSRRFSMNTGISIKNKEVVNESKLGYFATAVSISLDVIL